MVLYLDSDVECAFREYVKNRGSTHGDLKRHTSEALKEYLIKNGAYHE